ncbi:anti-sigma factor antagonist [Nitrospira sp.]|nr:anti-sigma factor antagonist [Nitrospira sp.]
MEIIDRKIGDVSVVRVQGRLDSQSAESLGTHLGRLIDSGERHLVVDGEALEYISSTGLRVLLVAAKRLKGAQGTIVLSTLQPHILEVFEIAGFRSLFSIYGNVGEATRHRPG